MKNKPAKMKANAVPDPKQDTKKPAAKMAAPSKKKDYPASNTSQADRLKPVKTDRGNFKFKSNRKGD